MDLMKDLSGEFSMNMIADFLKSAETKAVVDYFNEKIQSIKPFYAGRALCNRSGLLKFMKAYLDKKLEI
jgi:hypothetical protein